MDHPQLTAVAAVARNGVIGVQGRLPWHLPADLKHFKAVTAGGILIMGRATYQSIGRPLAGRLTFVVSRSQSASAIQWVDATTGWAWAGEPANAVGSAWQTGRPVFVVGGGDIYRACWDWLTDLVITEVDQAPAGDTFFPAIGSDWAAVERQEYDGYAYVHYRRT